MNAQLETLQRRALIAPHGLKRQRLAELQSAVNAALVLALDENVNRAARLCVEGRV